MIRLAINGLGRIGRATPTDPPILPSEEEPEGVEVAAGFGPSMEDSNPDVERLPDTVDNNDLDLLDNIIYLVLRNISETGHLTDQH